MSCQALAVAVTDVNEAPTRLPSAVRRRQGAGQGRNRRRSAQGDRSGLQRSRQIDLVKGAADRFEIVNPARGEERGRRSISSRRVAHRDGARYRSRAALSIERSFTISVSNVSRRDGGRVSDVISGIRRCPRRGPERSLNGRGQGHVTAGRATTLMAGSHRQARGGEDQDIFVFNAESDDQRRHVSDFNAGRLVLARQRGARSSARARGKAGEAQADAFSRARRRDKEDRSSTTRREGAVLRRGRQRRGGAGAVCDADQEGQADLQRLLRDLSLARWILPLELERKRGHHLRKHRRHQETESRLRFLKATAQQRRADATASACLRQTHRNYDTKSDCPPQRPHPLAKAKSRCSPISPAIGAFPCPGGRVSAHFRLTWADPRLRTRGLSGWP